MIKRDITETVYEYDKEGKLVKKTVTETHEEDSNTSITYPYTSPSWRWPEIYCNTSETNKIPELQKSLNDYLTHTQISNDWQYTDSTSTSAHVETVPAQTYGKVDTTVAQL